MGYLIEHLLVLLWYFILDIMLFILYNMLQVHDACNYITDDYCHVQWHSSFFYEYSFTFIHLLFLDDMK